MRRHLVLAGTLAGLLALGAPAPAAPPAAPTPHVTDLTGDANGVNGQAQGLPVPDTATEPASVGAADIVNVTFATIWKGVGRARRANGFTVTMQLSQAPAQGIAYAVLADVPSTCDGKRTILYLNYLDYLGASDAHIANCMDASVGGATRNMLVNVKADLAKKTITWTLSKGLKNGAEVTSIKADTSILAVGFLDEASGGRPYTYGA